MHVLEKGGYRVSVAVNGEQVLKRIEKKSIDLILMDVQMPMMDGLEASRQIRQRENDTSAHLPIIAMTAHALKGDREKCLDAGMDDYVPKPIVARKLLAKVSTWLAKVNERSGPKWRDQNTPADSEV